MAVTGTGAEAKTGVDSAGPGADAATSAPAAEEASADVSAPTQPDLAEGSDEAAPTEGAEKAKG